MKVLLVCLLAAVCWAQTPAPSVAARGSVSGVVRSQGTGEPLADSEVMARASGPGARPVRTKADSQGRYTLRSLEPGAYTIYATTPRVDGVGFGAMAERSIEIQGDQELTGIDIVVSLPGQIAGRVLDQNGEPVAGMNVLLVAREYSFGALRYVFASSGISDDQGRYTVGRVTPGRAFLLMAMKRQLRLPAISDAPDDPALRRPALLPAYYPDSPNAEGGQLLTLRSGEQREGVDLRVRKTRSYCIEGILTGPSGPADLRFTIAPPRPHSGLSGSGGMYMGQPGGTPGPDGKIRICDLAPGDYDLEVTQWPKTASFGGPEFMGVARVTISDQDVGNVRVSALPKLRVSGEVVLEGPQPDKPLDAELSINLTSISRTIRPSAKSKIPGEFTFDDMVLDDYSMNIRGLTGSQYLKEMTYGGQSILKKTLRPGSTQAGSGVRVVVGRDGAFLSATVQGEDNKPVADAHVAVFPAVTSEADLAAFLVTGVTNQNGAWTSPALAPGKYYVLTSRTPVDKSPESIEKLMRSRTLAQEVTLAPNGTASVKVEAAGGQ